MPREITLNLKRYHPGQQQVIDQRKRFNVLCCGRRWGKTSLAQDLLLGTEDGDNGVLRGYPVAYFAPTYKMLAEFWREVKTQLHPVITKVIAADRRIYFFGGGWVDFWSLDNPDSVRGRKYKRVVVDEAAIVRDLKYAWTEVIRPLLTDLQGDAYFLSTPKGTDNYFHELFEMPAQYPEAWMRWQMPTATNPHIAPTEIQAAEQQLDPISFAQEYLASFVTSKYDAWAYAYSRERHVKKVALNRAQQVYLSFDFNRNPITCAVLQYYNNVVWGVEQIKLQNSNIYALCDYITAKYTGCMFLITGDASGRASTAMMRDNINYYVIIKEKLRLAPGQLKVPTANPRIDENRVLVNSVLHNMDVRLDPDACKGLIFDLEHARIMPSGELDKSNRNDPTKQLDALDCFTGDTLITTNTGARPIRHLRIGDNVLTRAGYRPIVDHWQSEAEVWLFTLNDGTQLHCTRNHRMFINDDDNRPAWMPIFECYEKQIPVWQHLSRTTTNDITGLAGQNIITTKNAKHCIDAFGKIIPGKRFRRVMKYITSTAIRKTTNHKTLHVLKRLHTGNYTHNNKRKTIRNDFKNLQPLVASMQKHGTGRQPVLHGTNNMPPHFNSGISISEHTIATNAALHLKDAARGRDFAGTIASPHGGEKPVHMKPRIIVSAEKLGWQPVYDITVADEPEFFANGILAHNCFRYFCNTFLRNALRL